jgi:hypothetical protein
LDSFPNNLIFLFLKFCEIHTKFPHNTLFTFMRKKNFVWAFFLVQIFSFTFSYAFFSVAIFFFAKFYEGWEVNCTKSTVEPDFYRKLWKKEYNNQQEHHSLNFRCETCHNYWFLNFLEYFQNCISQFVTALCRKIYAWQDYYFMMCC